MLPSIRHKARPGPSHSIGTPPLLKSTVSVPGVYGGLVDKFPFGAAFGKGLTLKMGQTHVHRYLAPLLNRIQQGEIDPSFLITHRFPLEDAPYAYSVFQKKQDECIKVVLKP